MNVGLAALRAKIAGFHVTGARFRKNILKSTGLRRSRWWYAKRAVGVYCRYHMIAYGLLRGIPYERIERCGEHNRPDAQKVYDVLKQHVWGWEQERQWTLEAVQTALKTAGA